MSAVTECFYVEIIASHLHGNDMSSNLRFIAMSILWFQSGALYCLEGLIFVAERNVTCVF